MRNHRATVWSALTVCLAGIVGVSMARSRVEAVGQAVLGAADDSLGFVDQKLDRGKVTMQDRSGKLEHSLEVRIVVW